MFTGEHSSGFVRVVLGTGKFPLDEKYSSEERKYSWMKIKLEEKTSWMEKSSVGRILYWKNSL